MFQFYCIIYRYRVNVTLKAILVKQSEYSCLSLINKRCIPYTGNQWIGDWVVVIINSNL